MLMELLKLSFRGSLLGIVISLMALYLIAPMTNGGKGLLVVTVVVATVIIYDSIGLIVRAARRRRDQPKGG